MTRKPEPVKVTSRLGAGAAGKALCMCVCVCVVCVCVRVHVRITLYARSSAEGCHCDVRHGTRSTREVLYVTWYIYLTKGLRLRNTVA
eukprot:1147540-Pelagomonas_calceolata.AAC.2